MKAAVQAVVDTWCCRCHFGPDAPAGMRLSPDISIQVNVPSAECPNKLRIAAGNSQASYLADKILAMPQDGPAGCFMGGPMPAGPPGAFPLSDANKATIINWINAGAPR